jgi:hypothetical protein
MPELELKRLRCEELAWVIELFTRQEYPDDSERAQRHFADHAEGEGASFLAFVQGELAG